MPVTALPNLEHVFAKWEQRGRGQTTLGGGDFRPGNSNNNADRILADGRQKWREKYGNNVHPVRRRPIRERNRPAALPLETVRANTIAQFKSSPTIKPEEFMVTRPFMGQCCACMPNSQKDLIRSTTANEGMRNVLDTRHELRNSSSLARRCSSLVYVWSCRNNHRYKNVTLDVLANQRVVDVIQQELLAEEVKSDQERLEKQARHILGVMKARISNTLTKVTTWLLHHILPTLIASLQVHKGQMKVIKAASERGLPVLYLPLHRSHWDYILITFILTSYGIKNPHIAAGDNLNIPFFKHLIKGLGGFFIRRKLDKSGAKRDTIYRSILHTYMEQLLCDGEGMEFFVEGGRSRTGKAYPPKGGLMSVIVDTINRGLVEDIYMVPVSISYERILDGDFKNEQMGLPKKKETFRGAVRAILGMFSMHYGSVRVDFAQPFSLKEYLQNCQPSVSSPRSMDQDSVDPLSSGDSLSSSPPVLHRFNSNTSLYGTDVVIEDQRAIVKCLGEHVIHSCVATTALMSTNLLAFLLLTKHRKGVGIAQLVRDYNWLREEVIVRKRDIGFSPSCNSAEVVHYAAALLGSSLVQKQLGADSQESVFHPNTTIPDVFELNYYSNPVISVFLLESILVNAVIYKSDINLSTIEVTGRDDVTPISRDEVLEIAEQLCGLLQFEFIFVPPCMHLEEALSDTLDQLVTSEILQVDDSHTQSDTYQPVFEKQWAQRLSDSLSWAENDDDDDDMPYMEEQLLRVNVDRDDSREKLRFLHSVLAPILETYLVTAHNISQVIDQEIPEDDFIRTLHSQVKARVSDGVASYGESAALETVKNAIKAFKELRIIDIYYVSNLRMLGMYDHFEVKGRLEKYLLLLQALRD